MGRLQNNPSIGWVHPKSTHAHPLARGNKNLIIEEHQLCSMLQLPSHHQRSIHNQWFEKQRIMG
jgi:hypothetical protein